MINYKPLFKTMISQNITLSDLANEIDLNPNVVAKFKKGKNVHTKTLEKICLFLNCKIQDVIEILPDQPEQEAKEE